MSVVANISNFLGINADNIRHYMQLAPSTYKMFTIPKKNGKPRVIYHPSQETKSLQYAFMHLYLNSIPVHKSAVAYVKGLKSPIRNNASIHAKFKYSIRIDFKDFFYSFVPEDVFSVMKHHYKFTHQDFNCIKDLAFLNHNNSLTLTIGAPISPILTNIVMYELDEVFTQFAVHFNGEYTRYADDLIFSSNDKKSQNMFLDNIKDVVSKTLSPKLTINDAKTLFMSQKSRKSITGLIVTPEGYVSIGRNKKRIIKSLAFKLVKKTITDEEKKYLKGFLAYLQDVEPSFYNSLVLKYGSVLIDNL